MTEMLDLIKNYVRASEFAVEKLRTLTGCTDLMRAWRDGGLKKADSIVDVRYEFHGSGIYIEIENEEIKVEVDFLPGGQAGGFDSWRIWQWVQSGPQRYPALLSHQSVREGLQELIARGDVVGVEGTSLFCLNERWGEDGDTHK